MRGRGGCTGWTRWIQKHTLKMEKLEKFGRRWCWELEGGVNEFVKIV